MGLNGSDGAISWFQHKIGTYDKANWEITVEKQEVPALKNLGTANLDIANVRSDLLDLDLLRGSTFTKAKPVYHWTQVTAKAFVRVVFFPIYYKWWLQQTSGRLWLFFTGLYFMQLVALLIYVTHQNDKDFKFISWPETFVPILAMILLGEMYIHVVSTNFTKPLGHQIKKKIKEGEQMRPRRTSVQTKRKKRKPHNTPSVTAFGSDLDQIITGTSVHNKHSLSAGSDADESSHDEEHVVNHHRQHTHSITSQGPKNQMINDSPRLDAIEDRNDHKNDSYVEEVFTNNTGLRNRIYKERVPNLNKESGFVASASDNKGTDITTNSDMDKEKSPEKKQRKIKYDKDSIESVAHSSDTNSSNSSTTDISDHECTETKAVNLDDPFLCLNDPSNPLSSAKNTPSFYLRGHDDIITVSLWDGVSFKKAKLTFLEIGMAVVERVDSTSGKVTTEYISFAIFSALLIGMLPLIFRIYTSNIISFDSDDTINENFSKVISKFNSTDGIIKVYKKLFGKTYKTQAVVVIAMVSRISLSFSMFFLLCVAEASYQMRYRYAKYFGALTSTRRARRNGLPHFRLHKVKNIKAWLSLRSFLKKRGPQRSVDTIISAALMIGVLLLVVACVQFIIATGKNDDTKSHFLFYFYNWELTIWCLIFGIFLIRFISLGSEINRKYRNNSVLLTEQINLYLQMENSPNKKEELIIANNVLKLAGKLIKELEGPFKMLGVLMNPLLSNTIRVVVLSLFSGVLTDILGFRLRLWKIKAG